MNPPLANDPDPGGFQDATGIFCFESIPAAFNDIHFNAVRRIRC
jgi:hypothetical protein